MASSSSFARRLWAVSSSILATMRFCSASGGMGTSICSRRDLEILARVVPDDCISIKARATGELIVYINQ